MVLKALSTGMAEEKGLDETSKKFSHQRQLFEAAHRIDPYREAHPCFLRGAGAFAQIARPAGRHDITQRVIAPA